ncbi:DUF6517 family protein [Haloarcula onubensis]|uniref:DUF6517 family protein n=1 Tax=Haloarcula onubensis TaxID=2950539 RepID=A0ABU2FMI9_9EURY|nr:DUF6517 family protein [Halomicroarcula sp. S3CR25-11]MDS0281452.1 DUF6517 family protein [Halomicroarcula sp. S3CR25-11]
MERDDGRSPIAVVGRVRGRSRRRLLLGIGAIAVLVCLAVLLALVPLGVLGLVVDDSARFEATPAVPDDATLSATGYELDGADTVTVERHRTVAGQDRTIAVANPQRVYRKDVRVGDRTVPGGVFATVATPAIEIAGSPRNPVAAESHSELLGRFQSRLGAGENSSFRAVSTREAVLVGSRTTVTTFETTVTVDGERRAFAVYVTTARSNGDVVVAVGGHPTAFPDERVAIVRLIYAVEVGAR